jgi:hypothetical protein
MSHRLNPHSLAQQMLRDGETMLIWVAKNVNLGNHENKKTVLFCEISGPK